MIFTFFGFQLHHCIFFFVCNIAEFLLGFQLFPLFSEMLLVCKDSPQTFYCSLSLCDNIRSQGSSSDLIFLSPGSDFHQSTTYHHLDVLQAPWTQYIKTKFFFLLHHVLFVFSFVQLYSYPPGHLREKHLSPSNSFCFLLLQF